MNRIANSDIKDKTSLVDARKAIEREMERFKVCEKEAKTKTYSKAGLGQAAKVDPEEKAKQDQRDWLNDQVEALKLQVQCQNGGIGRASFISQFGSNPGAECIWATVLTNLFGELPLHLLSWLHAYLG